jgi:hypothetical protein
MAKVNGSDEQLVMVSLIQDSVTSEPVRRQAAQLAVEWFALGRVLGDRMESS